MRIILPVLRSRRRQRTATRRTSLYLPALIASFLFSTVVLFLAALAAFFFWNVQRDLPSVQRLPGLIEPPDGMIFHPTRIYDRSGQQLLLELRNPGGAGFTYLPLAEDGENRLSQALADAAVALLDPQFWEHSGAVWRLDAPPTLAEKIVSRFLLWHEPPGWRRILRMKLLAVEATSVYGRERILEWYLNSANYGRLAFGADAAARVYFGKSAARVDLMEAAMLAAALRAPALNPQDNPEAAQEGARAALDALSGAGIISTEEANKTVQMQIRVLPAQPLGQEAAPAFVQQAVRQLVDQFGWERLEQGGMTARTTLDPDLQRQLTCASQTAIQRLQGRQVETPADCAAARLMQGLPSPEASGAFALAGDAAVMDARTGQVMALFSEHPPAWESALGEGRPAGSLLSPFVYLAAFTRGFGPASLVWDLPPDAGAAAQDYAGPMRARMALANEKINVTEILFRQIGAGLVWKTARQMGLYLPDDHSPADTARLLRGGGRVHLLEIVQAYAALANQGVQAGQVLPNPNLNKNPEALLNLSPSFLLKVEDQAGKVWLDWEEPRTRSVLTADLAFLLTHVLSDETARWQTYGHPNALEPGRPAGVKTGRTDDGRDVWTVGYTPRFSVGVWLGTQDADFKGRLADTAAAPLWNAILKYAENQGPLQTWQTPGGVTSVDVCDPSGMLPTHACPNVVREVFLRGSEPTQVDQLYFTRRINKETGNLATIHTDLDAVEERAFMRVPAGFEAWASALNIVLPPGEYDVLYQPSSHADAPGMLRVPASLEHLSGKVVFIGSAGGDDFAFYRLQAGKGLNPDHWLQIGDDHATPVKDGILETWDTTDLNGLYVLQLLVVEKSGRLHLSTAQYTVDNRPPVVKIDAPRMGERIAADDSGFVYFQVNASDDTALEKVVFFVDGKEVRRMTQPPFSAPWQGKPGLHDLTVTAQDAAGNSRSESVTFRMQD